MISGAVLLFASCDRTRNDKGYEYFPDMAHSLAFETYTKNDVFKGGMTQLTPVSGTVPREMIPYQFPATPEGRLEAGKTLNNPLTVDSVNIRIGKENFTKFCENCHGTAGKGDGHLYTSGKFTMQPASLITDKMKTTPEAEIFHVITVGWNTMGAHGAQIPVDNRWRIAMYVKNVLQSSPIQ